MIKRVCLCYKINERMYRNLFGFLRDFNLICIILCNREIFSIVFYNDKCFFYCICKSLFFN